MDDDMTARRAERLTPAGREVLAEIRAAMEADDRGAIPPLMERIGGLPPSDRGEILELVALAERGFAAERERLDEKAEAAEAARRVLVAAAEKLQAEGRPVDPNMTVEEAYRILEH